MIECIHEFEENRSEEGAAEALRCLKEHAEEIFFDDENSRIFLSRQIWDESIKEFMDKINETLKIKTRDEFIKFKEKYNITMY